MKGLWYAMVLRLAGRLRHASAAVSLEDWQRGLDVHYHGLGGPLSEQPLMPRALDRYATAELNRELYFWLAAFLALDRPLPGERQLAPGVRHLLRGAATSARVARAYPGLAERYRRLCAAELEQRVTALPISSTSHPVAALEVAIRFALGGIQPPDSWLLNSITAVQSGEPLPQPSPRSPALLPFLPVPLWGYKSPSVWGLRLPLMPRRRRPDRRGADPGPGVSGTLYPEWDYRRRAYRQQWCVVSEESSSPANNFAVEPASAALARQVRRQFEALRQAAGWNRRRETGEDLDLDAYVDSVADARGCGHRSGRIYRERTHHRPGLAVAALLDCSRSTEARVGAHQVIGIERDAMYVLAEALSAGGDDFGLYAFASDSRLRVRCFRVKGFDEGYGETSRRRLAALQPGHYTRIGAAVRHVSARLEARRAAQKLLLVLTDGRPHDPADGYEGRYGIEDTRRALHEARSRGMHCFGLAINRSGKEYLSQQFGPGHYAVLSDPRSLPQVLPSLYARITY